MTSASATSESSGLGSRGLAGQLLPYLGLVLIHLLSGLQVDQPLILADEVGYLGNARYLSGAAHLPDMRGTGFYHFGYSLFLMPAFWLFAEPFWIYKATIAINALLVSALYFPLRFILTSAVQLPARSARWIAFACCLYPPLVLYSGFAWSENAFITFYAVATALFARFLATRSSGDALLLGLVVGFLYTIHPRALPILVAVPVYLVLLAGLRVIRKRQLLLGLSTIATVFAITRFVNQHLKSTGWGSTGEVSATKLAGRLVPDADFPALIERALGQVLYLSLASHGLALVGLMAMIWLIVRKIRSGSLRDALATPTSGVPLFILMTAAGVFIAAVTLKLYSLHGEQAVRGADFIHGRYNEALAVLGIAYGLAEWWKSGLGKRRVIWRVVVVSGVILCLVAVVMAEVNDALRRQVADLPGVEPQELVLPSRVDAVAVAGVYPLVGAVGALDLYPISAIVIGSFALITLTMRFSRRGGVVVLMLLFASFSYYNHRYYLFPRIAATRPRLAMAAEMRRLGPITTVSYDAAYREPGFVPAMQFLVQDAMFQRFDSSRGEKPGAEAVISGTDWSQAEDLGARFVMSSGRGSALWILPGEMQARLRVAAYEGVILGARRRPDLWESGFYREESFAVGPGRWTDGAASLRVPLDSRSPPRTLEIETLAPGREGTRLQVLANGVELWHEQIPLEAWSKTFSLEGVPLGEELLIELNSDTFFPKESRPGSKDRRRLGVVVTGIRLSGVAPGGL